MSRTVIISVIRSIAAIAMVAVVHGFMVGFGVPRPEAWYVGAMIYSGLVAVLFARRSLIDKLGTYFVFVVITVVGAVTVCPCTGAHQGNRILFPDETEKNPFQHVRRKAGAVALAP